MEGRKVRPSSWPLFELCPSSQEEIEHPVDSPSDAARLGEAVHIACSEYISSGHRDPDYEHMAGEYRCDQSELEMLSEKAMSVAQQAAVRTVPVVVAREPRTGPENYRLRDDIALLVHD